MSESQIEALTRRIEELEDKVNFLLNHEPAPYTPHSHDEKTANEAAVVELLKKGKAADAMRLFRQTNEMPFPDMQKAIEELKKKHGIA
ncbi:MAG TPA: hypothetical protein VIU38_10510 [Anaerolineales bacterium]